MNMQTISGEDIVDFLELVQRYWKSDDHLKITKNLVFVYKLYIFIATYNLNCLK